MSPELIQVATGSTKWQQPFDATLTDVFKVQADVAGQVAQALDVALGAPQRAGAGGAADREPAAYDAYLKGEAASQQLGTRRSARRCARRSATTSRRWRSTRASPQAWAALSRASSLLYFNGTPSPAARPAGARGGGAGARAEPEPLPRASRAGRLLRSGPSADCERGAARVRGADCASTPNDVDLLAVAAR